MATEKRIDLIDRLKLLDSLGYDPMKFWAITPESTFGIVLNAHAVDAVEVVRCKDCRWRKNGSLCYMISGCGEPVGTGDDFFCSYGERKRNE